MKNNTNYFSHDWNAHEDMKCLELKMKHWLEWYWLYWEIVERLFNEWWKLLLSKNKAIAYQLHISEQTFDTIFSTLLEIWLLVSDNNEYYSESLLKRIMIKDEIKKKRQEAWRQWWIANSKQKLANAKQIASNKTKLNKTKLNEEEAENRTKELSDFIEKRNGVKKFWLANKWLPKTKKITDKLKNVWRLKRKDYSIDDIRQWVNNYCLKMKECKPRDNKDTYYKHRFTLYEFLKQDNWLDKYFNQ